MKSLIWAVLLVFSVPSFLFPQIKTGDMHRFEKINCSTCHRCKFPTSQDPCLWPCPRVELIKTYKITEKAPETIVIDKLMRLYQPVTFPHKLHADMADISGGCVQCHHYSLNGEIRLCSDCHASQRKRNDVSRPDLTGAYHQQCMNCHRSWSHKTECVSCHQYQNKANLTGGEEHKSKVKKHPKLVPPEKIIFKADSTGGKRVVFFHREHYKTFGFACADCHKDELCIKCHDVNNSFNGEKTSLKLNTKDSEKKSHAKCNSCHSIKESCSICHNKTGQDLFNHGKKTGWALKRYHNKLKCMVCHGNKKQFKKLNTQCSSCHGDWDAQNFDHKVTGLALDENHIDNECGDCHLGKNFSVPPSCNNCHDNKHYPKDKPGKPIKEK